MIFIFLVRIVSVLVDIIILTFNKSEYSEYCIKGLIKTTYRPLRVIVVDNGSTDTTPDLLERFKKYSDTLGISVEIIYNKENRGAITGRNQALELVKGDFVVFLDNDVVIKEGEWLETLTSFLSDHNEVGAVSPKLIYPVFPFLIQCAGCDVSPTGKVNFRGRGVLRGTPEFNKQTKVQALISACMVVPVKIIEQVGKFDKLFSPVQFEDIDYCYRIREAGYKLMYLPEVEMYHFENVTTSRTKALNPAYNTIKNGMKFKKKWHHVFSKENGPDKADMKWVDIKPVFINDLDRTLFEYEV